MYEDTIKTLINVAMGKEKADLVIRNATLVNVYSNELLKNSTIAVKGEKIAFVGVDGRHTIGPKTNVIDASGKVVIPGLIDAHTHLDIPVVFPTEYARYSLLTGTTTIITETLELANAMGHDPGYEGLLNILEAFKRQPVKIFAVAPSYIPALSSYGKIRPFTREETKALLNMENVLGLGETAWNAVLDENEEAIEILSTGLEAGKRLDGHAAGAKKNKLVAYAASGVTSCHESITGEEAIEKLRLGLAVMIREGSIRQDLEAISKIKDRVSQFERFMLVSDGLNPQDIIRNGHMSYIVQKAIDLGFDPVQAIRMASLNPAGYFRIDHICGGIAPSRDADMVIIPDIRTVQCETVISKGRIAACNGKLLVQMEPYHPLKKLLDTVHIRPNLNSCDFDIPVKEGLGEVNVRVIDQVSDLITKELVTKVQVKDHYVSIDTDRDLLKIAVISRKEGQLENFTGLIHGFGMKDGAFASSCSWETGSPVVVIGARETDMGHAVHRIAELKGGIVVAHGGKIVAELSLPIGGFIASCPVEEAAARLEQIRDTLRGLGCFLNNPYLSLQVLTGVFLPYFRITRKGLVNTKDRKLVPMFID
jgi:adenine deaminase